MIIPASSSTGCDDSQQYDYTSMDNFIIDILCPLINHVEIQSKHTPSISIKITSREVLIRMKTD